MNAPICDFVKKFNKKHSVRFHVPGHKGKKFIGNEHLDITEITNADTLFNAQGIILESQQNASSLFGCTTFYSTEGSSLSIRAMLHLICLYAKVNNKATKILSLRNVHKSFLSACALLNVDVDWINTNSQNNSYLSQNFSLEDLDAYLQKTKTKPVAFYITSPNYLGEMVDVYSIANICHKHGILLAVDCAHGSYLKFLKNSQFPIDLGADICCSSAHKTLPVLTGGAYLHISHNAPKIFIEEASNSLSLFGSTSPSYLILQSLDNLNKYLATSYRNKLENHIVEVENLKAKISLLGIEQISNERQKITLATKSFGYLASDFAEILSKNNIEVEFFDKDFIVLMTSPFIRKKDLKKLYSTLSKIKKLSPIAEKPPKIEPFEKALSISETLMKETEIVSIDQCENRIYAQLNHSCPPAIPILICGEKINKNAIEIFKYYGVTHCKVVK